MTAQRGGSAPTDSASGAAQLPESPCGAPTLADSEPAVPSSRRSDPADWALAPSHSARVGVAGQQQGAGTRGRADTAPSPGTVGASREEKMELPRTGVGGLFLVSKVD